MRVQPNRKEFPYRRDQDGRALCRNCGAVVKPPRRWWCNDACVEVLLSQNWNLLKDKVEKRDKGICAECGCDTEKLHRVMSHAETSMMKDGRFMLRWDTTARLIKRLGFNPGRSLFEVDHIVEVVRGGENRLDNLQTLCVPCHKAKTARLARERAQERRDSQRGLLNQ